MMAGTQASVSGLVGKGPVAGLSCPGLEVGGRSIQLDSPPGEGDRGLGTEAGAEGGVTLGFLTTEAVINVYGENSRPGLGLGQDV